MSQHILITGANGGIGSSLCHFFKEKKWHVIGCDLHPHSKNNSIDSYYQINLTVEKDIQELFKKLKRIDCLVNCAAYQCCKPVWEYTTSEWDNSYHCNVRAVFLCVKYGIEIFKKYHTTIINISSIHSVVTSKHISAYASTKSALVGLTRNLAIDLSVFGIRVNSISPGAIDTPMLQQHLSKQEIKDLTNKHLLSKIGQPQNISSVCWMIINNDFINGSNLVIDGGVSGCLFTE